MSEGPVDSWGVVPVPNTVHVTTNNQRLPIYLINPNTGKEWRFVRETPDQPFPYIEGCSWVETNDAWGPGEYKLIKTMISYQV